tara:strand:- start:4914 stop:5465 length:552 start_codon:yes stop_codon:yes gene_type:complete
LNKAIFLDRDGVINEDYGYVYEIDKFSVIPGVFDAMRYFQENGFILIVITNQAGIARGFYSESDLDRLNVHMVKVFASENIDLSRIYHCPHHPTEGVIKSLTIKCCCRKPNIGMIQKAVGDHNINLSQSWLIGDKLSDIQAGNTCGLVGSILVGSQRVPVVNKNNFKYYKAKNLLDSCKIILG